MNKQEIFDKVWDWFVVQKNPCSLNERMSCSYRGQNNEKCAIGIFIPDDMYVLEMEGGVYSLLIDFPQVREIFCTQDETFAMAEFLNMVQKCHDNNATLMSIDVLRRNSPECFQEGVKKSLLELAEMHRLNVSHLKEAA